MSVVFYTRPGCTLCEKARAALDAAAIAYEEVDVSKDRALEAEYGILIPVVEVDGRGVFEAGMDPAELPSLVGGGWRA